MSKVSNFRTFCCICTYHEPGKEVAKYMKERLLTKYGTKYKVELDWNFTIDKDKVDSVCEIFTSCKYCVFIFTKGCEQDRDFETCWKHADQYRHRGLTNVISIIVKPFRQEDLPFTMQNLHTPLSFPANFKDNDENWKKVLECLSPDNVLTSGSAMSDNLTDESNADYESRSILTPSKTPQQAMVQAISVDVEDSASASTAQVFKSPEEESIGNMVSNMETMTISPAHPPKEKAGGDCPDGDDEHIFCWECGKRLICPNAKYCTKCGTKQ